MKRVSEYNNIDKDELKRELSNSYDKACENIEFVELVNKLKLKKEDSLVYTSKLLRSVSELHNCKNCKGLSSCKNSSKGYYIYPVKYGKVIYFENIACKKLLRSIEREKKKTKIYLEPLEIENASMKDIDLTDKKREKLIKAVNKFYKDYQNDKNIKGLYVHGSFGSGKTYIIASLFNALSQNGYKALIIYYPEMLRLLKSSFQTNYDELMESIKNSDLLLIDDIGAESITSWSRDEVLGTILQYRMDNKLPTFFTSNLDINELEIHLRETNNSIDSVKARRIIERIKQLTNDIEIISKNRRV